MPESELSKDRAWLAGYRSGDPKALERVFRTYARLVLHIVRRGTGTVPGRSGQDEEDLVHEVFARALSATSRERYDGVVPFAAYLRGIARRVLLESHRPARAELSDVMAEPAHALDGWDPGQPSPDDWLMTAQEIEVAARFRELLSEHERSMVDARFAQGLSQRDAAQQLGTTRQILRRAETKILSQFAAFLRKEGFLEKK